MSGSGLLGAAQGVMIINWPPAQSAPRPDTYRVAGRKVRPQA
jgi:hypothetical protein